MQSKKVIEYWFNSAKDDQKVAKHLFEKKDYTYALFFGHLYLEKLLKALVVKTTGIQASPIHNLRVLSEQTKLIISDDQIEFLIEIQEYNLRARYPDFKLNFKKRCTREFTLKQLTRIGDFGKWLKKQF